MANSNGVRLEEHGLQYSGLSQRPSGGKNEQAGILWPAIAGHWPSRPGEAQNGWEPPRVVGNAEHGSGSGLRSAGLQGQARPTAGLETRRLAVWQTQPPLGFDVDGLPAAMGGAWPEVHNRVAQLKSAGNAILPEVAAIFLNAIRRQLA
jgi:hypothetical protein